MATNTLLSLLDSEQDWFNAGVCGEGGKDCCVRVLANAHASKSILFYAYFFMLYCMYDKRGNLNNVGVYVSDML